MSAIYLLEIIGEGGKMMGIKKRYRYPYLFRVMDYCSDGVVSYTIYIFP